MKKIILLYLSAMIFCISCEKESESTISSEGKGGSMARFTIAGNFLYIVDNTNLHAYDISNKSKPTLKKTVGVGEGIETIFPYKGNLFIGSQNGMYIYRILEDGTPQKTSNVSHFMSCDPVVADNKYAYVTLRAGGNCRSGWGANNQLDIIDISNLSNPHLLVSHLVNEPYGLTIDENVLFICHGEFGLGIYDVSNPLKLVELKRIKNVDAYDVISENKILILIGKTGFYQYDYSDINNIELLSNIPVGY